MTDYPTNLTTLASALQTSIETNALIYYQKHRVFRGLIPERFRRLVPNGTYATKFQRGDYLTFGTHTEGSNFAAEAYTTFSRTLTPVFLGTRLTQGYEATTSTPLDLGMAFAEAAGNAWAYAEDSDTTYGYAATYAEAPSSTPTHDLGTNGVAYTANLILQGAQLLQTQSCPQPYNLVIDPIQWKELMGDAEARQWLVNRPQQMLPGSYAATTGIDLNRFLGVIHGVNVWVGDAMVESSGLHSIMFGEGALGQAYKLISTPLSPTPSEMSAEAEWDSNASAWQVNFRIYQHNEGICEQSDGSATTNVFMVDIIS